MEAVRINRAIKYRPLPSQAAFHRSEARFKGFSGAVGSGKSQALCHEAIRMSYLNPGRTGFLGAPTYPMLRDATLSSLQEILEESKLPYQLNRSEFVLKMGDIGSRILLRSLDDSERLRGTNLAWFGIDEMTYVSEEAWTRLEARLRDPKASRLCGFGVWTPKGFDWVYRRFLSEPVTGYEVVLARPRENKYLLERTPDFYDRLKQSYDEQFYRQEVLGEYLTSNGGLVYREFNRSRNVVAVGLNKDLPLLWALDFNVDPMSSIVAQRQGDELYVLDEIVISRASTLDACAEFARRYPRHEAGLVIYGDASGSNLKTTGTTDYQMIQQYFRNSEYRRFRYSVPKSNPAVRDRILMMNAKLCNAAGDVQLYISAKCKELLKDMEQVEYKPDTCIIEKNRDPKRTHLSDALGYLVWQECHAASPIGECNRRLI